MKNHIIKFDDYVNPVINESMYHWCLKNLGPDPYGITWDHKFFESHQEWRFSNEEHALLFALKFK